MAMPKGRAYFVLCFLLILCRPAFAQNLQDIGRSVQNVFQKRMAQAAQAEWVRLPLVVRTCIDDQLRSQGQSVEFLANQGVFPTDARLAAFWPACRHPEAQAPQQAAFPGSPYVVDGLSLGDQVAVGSDAYRRYHCGPSDRFSGFTWCHKEETKRDGRNEVLLANTILHREDSKAWYVNRYIEPAFFKPNDVQDEINRLSAKFAQPATEYRMPPRHGLPNAIIAVWGKLQLEPLDTNDVATVATGGATKGLLVSFLGDVQRSAKAGVPVYRLKGGPGYIWAATFNSNGRGVLRFLTADPSQIYESLVATNPNPLPQPPVEPQVSNPLRATAPSSAPIPPVDRPQSQPPTVSSGDNQREQSEAEAKGAEAKEAEAKGAEAKEAEAKEAEAKEAEAKEVQVEVAAQRRQAEAVTAAPRQAERSAQNFVLIAIGVIVLVLGTAVAYFLIGSAKRKPVDKTAESTSDGQIAVPAVISNPSDLVGEMPAGNSDFSNSAAALAVPSDSSATQEEHVDAPETAEIGISSSSSSSRNGNAPTASNLGLPSQHDLTEKLTKLAKLHADGALSDEEFKAAKARVISEAPKVPEGMIEDAEGKTSATLLQRRLQGLHARMRNLGALGH
jgi:hypothetical protein